MDTTVIKTVNIELTMSEALAVKSFIEISLQEPKGVPLGFINHAKKLVCQLEEVDV